MPEITPVQPTTLPEWATAGTAAVVEPPLAKKQQGWIVEKPPHEYFNWLQELTYDWINWANSAVPRRFNELSDALAALAVGELARIEESQFSTSRLGKIWGYAPGAGDGEYVATSGRFVFYGSASSVDVLDRQTGALLNNFGAGVNIHSMASDGEWLFVGGSNGEVKAISFDSAGNDTNEWTRARPGATAHEILCIYSDGPWVYAGGERQADLGFEHHVFAIDRATGALVAGWVYDFGAGVANANAIVADGRHVYVAHDQDAGGFDVTFLLRSAGPPPTVVDQYDSGAGISSLGLAQDENRLFVSCSNNIIRALAKANPVALLWSRDLTAAPLIPVTVDTFLRFPLARCGAWLYVAGNGTNTILSLDPATGNRGPWQYDHGLQQGPGPDVDVADMATDGFSLFTVGQDDDEHGVNPGDTCWRHNLHTPPRVIKIVDVTLGRYRARHNVPFVVDEYGEQG